MSHLKEVNKFLKLINAAKLKANHKECIELYNVVGGLCSEVGSYDEAIHYHEQALELCRTIGDQLGLAIASRYIGEAQASKGNFFQAIYSIKRYLEIAQKLKNYVEIQRAYTTLGRVYLMQAQDLKDKCTVIDKPTKDAAREAEKRFNDALNLAQTVRKQVDDKEHVQMISGLLINLGLIKEICGRPDEAITKLNKALELCRSVKLKEEVYRCQIILAGMHRQLNDVKLAVKTSEDALLTSKSIGKKVFICEALIEVGLARICQRDFKSAKRTLAQAYLEKSPNEEDHLKAIRLTKLAHLISTTYEKISTNNTPGGSRLECLDKLGDLFVAIGNYKLAVEYYRRAFSDARLCRKPRSELARIIYSLAETYADDLQFDKALVCYEKELEYGQGSDSDQCQTLVKIAHMREYLNQEPEQVCEAYERALTKAKQDPKQRHSVLRYYVPYMKEKAYNMDRYRELDEILTQSEANPMIVDEIEVEDQEEANEIEDEIADIDDIITDDEDNDQVLIIGQRRVKSGGKFKTDELGNTPLHKAAMDGQLARVKSLIALGHKVNPRDNVGWIPLHEACNHGHYEVAKCLIENGADVNCRGPKGVSPLHDAATNGHFDVMRLLISHGASVISLTDNGETVLSCLRDYKSRNSMSNREMTDYKEMEAELLNAMDKCGSNLLVEQSGPRAGPSSANVQSAKKPQQVRVREQKVDPVSDSPSPVKEYRDAIKTLKRKRPVVFDDDDDDEDEEDKAKRAAAQPALVQSETNTSLPTKQWFLDDDSILDENQQDEDDDDDVIFIDAKRRN